MEFGQSIFNMSADKLQYRIVRSFEFLPLQLLVAKVLRENGGNATAIFARLLSVCWIHSIIKKREKCYWFGEDTTRYGTIPFFIGFGIIQTRRYG